MSKKKEETGDLFGEKPEKETPLMKQYNQIKQQFPDALLLFRVGDFYETFGEDAIKAASALGIVLTRRANGSAAFIELAGFPHHSLETYLPKLVRAGYRVAICDQLEDPKMVKGIVKRGVTELITPGLAYSEKILEHHSNNFLASLHIANEVLGVSLLDISTGEYFLAQGNASYIEKIIHKFSPNEILFERNKRLQVLDLLGEKYYIYGIDDWAFTYDYGYESLTKQFGTNSLKGFGIEEMQTAIASCGAMLYYLHQTRHDKLKHITSLKRIDENEFIWLDKFTFRNLELIYPSHDGGKSLFDVINATVTPMGTRMLKRWVAMPLKNVSQINKRLDVIGFFGKQTEEATKLHRILSEMGDLERLVSKAAAMRVNPRELMQLKRTLASTENVKKLLQELNAANLNEIADGLHPCTSLQERLNQLHEDAPVALAKGKVIASGVDAELDDLRAISHSGKDYLLKIQQREIERTGITSLKVGYNNVFGYYLEVTNSHKDKAPADWMRKQTLTNAERYITPELKEYEEKILGAEEKIMSLETRLFEDLVAYVTEFVLQIQQNAAQLAKLDCLLGLSLVAKNNNYTRPVLNEGYAIDIKDGRHPVIEKQLPVGQEYVSNSVFLDNETQQLMMITGPNMSGKSALLRQTALIVLLAQIGSYVPAQSAEIGLIDKIFTRVGASDNISSGESTFMVEMNETASILNNLSNRSLILLDEIGRGTSTYDGISIAWAIAEYVHQNPNKAKTLFATHYHELNEMAQYFPRIKNFHVTIKELSNKVIFMRKLAEGGSEHSFGIHVAKMAGMPKDVVERAGEILKKLEKEHELEPTETIVDSEGRLMQKNKNAESEFQMNVYQLDDPILTQIKEEILNTDINTLTPVEALLKLNEIKRVLGK
ncbi:MAG TPA: DNA mismatch repair protein MutS [Bacteroidia bacterium]|jgi:DNA mismatch repair protein MutS|nr:DNA mismatch repair protein MutS [Bacteroidia bacterium]